METSGDAGNFPLGKGGNIRYDLKKRLFPLPGASRQGAMALKTRLSQWAKALLRTPRLFRLKSRIKEGRLFVLAKRCLGTITPPGSTFRTACNMAPPGDVLPFLERPVPLQVSPGPAEVLLVVNTAGSASALREFFRRLKAATPFPPFDLALAANEAGKERTFQGLAEEAGLPRPVVLPSGQGFLDSPEGKESTPLPWKYAVFTDDRATGLPGWLYELVHAMEEHPGWTACGPLLLHPPHGDRAGEDFIGLSVKSAGLSFRLHGAAALAAPRGLQGHPRDVNPAPREVPAFPPAVQCWRLTDLRNQILPRGQAGAPDLEAILRAREGGARFFVVPTAVVIHKDNGPPSSPCLSSGLSDRIRGRVLGEKIEGAPAFWADGPLTIGMVVTENNPLTIYGDYFSARGLGDELEKMGYRVFYFPERPLNRWRSLPSWIDVLVVLRHDFDLRLLGKGRNTVRVAWVRGYVEEWRKKPWFREYDLVLATSAEALRRLSPYTESRGTGGVLPLGVDADHFRPGPVNPEFEGDLAFVGNVFDAPRDLFRKLEIPETARFAFYGKLLDGKHRLGRHHRGEIPHARIPEVYNSVKIVLEDCTPMCRPWGCLNSRTFEAMACGAAVLSNEVPGLRELFGDAVATYANRDDLAEKIQWLLKNDPQRRQMGEKARRLILEGHTYRHRALAFRDLLASFFGVSRSP